jgi:translation elongation factor P/translation initiation factor 5A
MDGSEDAYIIARSHAHLFMDKKDWEKYQVTTDEGVKLVSQLTITEAKTQLCQVIELIEQLAELNQKGLDLLNEPHF